MIGYGTDVCHHQAGRGRAHYAGRIIQRIEDEGFQIRAMRLVHLTKREAEGFYAVHRERPFFASLTSSCRPAQPL